MNKNRLISLIICACMIICCLPGMAENDTIIISSAEDFKSFSKKCSLDTWSYGKTVLLEKDIDLSGTGAVPVPIFKGTFDGQGYTISGVNLMKNSSVAGLFRYIDGGGIVKNLNLNGTFEPGGTKTTIGAIAGENRGTIMNCTFEGKVKGKTNIGGIAGINQGQILNCVTGGTVYGEHYAGGIVGKNFGTVILCKNSANVNTTEEEVKFDIESINLEQIRSAENVVDITDIGGIAGFSSGIVQSCENNGDVGYEHVGYNIGGIAGRQSGYIDSCTNSGQIHGRKDAGGIAGQMEPHTILKYTEASLESLNGELDKLNELVDRVVNDSRNSKAIISARLSDTKSHISEARSISEELIDKANDRINNEIDNVNKMGESVNDLSARTAKMIDSTLNSTEAMSQAADNIKLIVDEYKEDFDSISEVFDDVDVDVISDGLKYLSDAASNLSKAVKYMARGLDRFRTGLGDQREKKQALTDIADGVKMYSDAMEEIRKATEDISGANENLKNNMKEENSSLKTELTALIDALTASLKNISGNSKNAVDGAAKIISGLRSLAAVIGDWDIGELYDGIEYLEISVDLLRSSMEQLAGAAKNLYGAWSQIKRAVQDSKDIIEEDDTRGDRLGDEIDKISAALEDIREAVHEFNQDPIITYDKIDSVYFEEKDKLSDSISNISDSIDAVKDSVGSFGDTVLDDVERISEQMSVIFDCLASSVDEAKNKSTDAEDYIEDVSEYDSKSQTDGKVSGSKNTGSVNADLNVGGIAGSMAVEYDFDPEDDVVSQGEKSMNFLYTTKAVVRNCTNSGDITAKKNYVGGIVGKADLGMIVESLGKGKIKSESGNYIGGVAGQSESVIKSCYAKCSLYGDDYIGGIAGAGDRIYNSYSIVNFAEFDEYAGAIAGTVNKACSGNLFVGDSVGGIDNISYAGKAQAVSYEDFIAMDSVPDDFRRFTITFVADEKVIDEVEFEYGGGLTEDKIPKVPQKDGCFGIWDKESFDCLTYDEVVEAVYDGYITAIESEIKRSNGLSVVVAEGDFSADSKLRLTKEDCSGRETEKWTVDIKANDNGEFTVHYLPNAKASRVKIAVLENEKEKKADCTIDGKYVVFKASGDRATFVVYKKYSFAVTAAVAALIAVLCVLAVLIRKKLKKHR